MSVSPAPAAPAGQNSAEIAARNYGSEAAVNGGTGSHGLFETGIGRWGGAQNQGWSPKHMGFASTLMPVSPVHFTGRSMSLLGFRNKGKALLRYEPIHPPKLTPPAPPGGGPEIH